LSETPSTAASASVESPYVGLTHYAEEYADWFFGRDAEIAVVIGNLRAARLTLLYAESGVGKSSLLRAGATARLHSLADRDAQTRGSPRLVPVVFSSWTDEPVAALIEAIEEAIRPYLAGTTTVELPRGRLDAAIQTAGRALDATLLVILDQFEEYFLYRPEDEGEDGFADQLARCVNSSDLRANFMISIRKDAYASLGGLFRGRISNVYGNFLHLKYLDAPQAREAVIRPIEHINALHHDSEPYEIEPALVDAVLDQVRRSRFAAGENGHRPADAETGGEQAGKIETTYLQLVMKRLWDEETGAGSSVLRMETLERLGGAQKIIGTHLDRSMSALSSEEQVAAASVFRFLVTRAGTKIALTAKDLSELSAVPESEVDPVLRRLSAGDLHILRPVAPRDGHGEVSYEIFHDALARPIVDWRTRKQEAELSARLDRERAEKERAQQHAIEAEEREARERKRKRFALAGVGVLLVVLLVLAGVLAVVQSDLAGERQSNAHSIQAADRIEEIWGSPDFQDDAAALASLEAYRLWPTVEARSQTLGVLQWNAGLPRVAVGHSRGVAAVAFWPDSSGVASAAFDGTVRLWDSQGRQLDVLRLESPVANSVAVSPPLRGGRRILAAALSGGGVDLWDVTELENAVHLRTLPGSSRGGENAVAFGPEPSGMLAAGGKDGWIRLWDVSNPDRPRDPARRQALGGIRDLAFAANGRALVSASDGGEQRWTLSGSGFSDREPLRLSSAPGSVLALGPGGAYAIDVVGGVELHSRGRVWSLPTTAAVQGLAFADHGRVLVSGGDDYSVTTWDTKTGRPFGPPRTHGYGWVVSDIAVSSDGRTIASAAGDNLVKLWPLDPEDALASTVGGLSPREAGGYVPTIWNLALGSGDRVAAAGGPAGAFIWSLEDVNDPQSVQQPLTKIPATVRRPTNAVAYHGDMLAVSRGGTFGLWNTGSTCPRMPDHACRIRGGAASGSLDTDLISSLASSGETLHTARISSLAFTGSGELLASADDEGNLNLWAVDEEGTIEHLSRMPRSGTEEIRPVVFSPTDPLLAAASDDGRVRVWDVSDPRDPSLVGEPLVQHEYQVVDALAFSPDGELLASGGQDQQIVLSEVQWDGEHDQDTITRVGGTLYHTNSIFALAFSPDGETLAAGDADAGVCFYDVESRRSIGLCPEGHFGRGGFYDVTFVGDGSSLLTAGPGNPIVAWDSILWNLDDDDETEGALTSAVCQLAGRNLSQAEWDEAFGDTDFADDRQETCSQYPLP
jgi:WD40 repeat protein